MKTLLRLFGVAHLVFGVAGVAGPRWFYAAVPPWPPLHVGQIQIAGIFDLALAVLFLGAATDVPRHLPVVAPAGAVAECGHAFVRLGHVVAGDADSRNKGPFSRRRDSLQNPARRTFAGSAPI